MTNIKHFSDLNGQTFELSGYGQPMANADFAKKWPGIKGRRYDSFSMLVMPCADTLELLPVTRVIERKSRPSNHVCDSRCMYATGRIMRCECSCGGKNHGNGGNRLN